MFLIFFILLHCMQALNAQGSYGYICVPVADLVAQPFSSHSNKSITEQYADLTLSPEQGKESCIRVGQALFNEKITILGYENEQIRIELHNCFYKPTKYFPSQPVRLWTHASNIVSENLLNSSDIPLSIFPEPYSWHTVPHHTTEIVHLSTPWYDPVTHMTYSVGTRFVIAHSTDTHYGVKIYDHLQKTIATTEIPKEFIVIPHFSCKQEQRVAFVSLLYQWCSLSDSIPFVWGGCSATDLCSDDVFVLQKIAKLSYWDRPSYISRPFCGFDAPGLLLRAAQICGITYYCCNTTTIEHVLEPLTYQKLEEGDLIWAPGYVGVISSLERQEIIEVQGYSRGYGKLHALPLSKRFAGIETWHDFLYYLNNTIPLKSLDAQGNIVAYITTFKIFKLPL